MSKFKSNFAVYAAFVLAIFGLSAQLAAAQTRGDRDTRSTVRSLKSGVDDFRYSLRYGVRNSGSGDAAAAVESDVSTLGEKIRDFESNLDQRRENRDDVVEILRAAKPIDDFVRVNRVNQTVQSDWSKVRTLLDKLAANYGVSWNWQRGEASDYPSSNYPTSNYPTTGGSQNFSRGLVGTYRLDDAKTEDVSNIVDGSGAGDADKADLEDKLSPASEVAIDIANGQVTLASSAAPAVSFPADGRIRTETQNGRTVRVRAQLRGQELTVSSVGGDTDYTLVFTSIDGGRSLKVTRRVTTTYLRQTVFADSFYTKTDAVARLDLGADNPSDDRTADRTPDTDQPADTNGGYSSNDPTDTPGSYDPNSPTRPNAPQTQTRRRTGDFIVPDGTVVVGILENYITTKASVDNDRFKLTVQSPAEFRGAVIDGYITGINRSGRVSGSSKVTFNFETITLRDGRKYEFAGFLQGITDVSGKQIKIDTEGTAKGDSQTKETAKRAGIGAGAGALIGAILGGGKGAAIGAVIGGGAGAGSVVVQGKDDIDLPKGSTITVTASAPAAR